MIHPDQVVEVRYRPMRPEDVEMVYAIDVLSFALPWSERSYRYEVSENPSSHGWVAEAVDGQGRSLVVGMAIVWLVLDEAHVATLATHPDFRRRGIARRLLAHSLLDMAGRGAVQVYLEVRRSNLAAQDLYRRFGFGVVGERPRYYVDNQEDALLMTLSPLEAERIRALLEAD